MIKTKLFSSKRFLIITTLLVICSIAIGYYYFNNKSDQTVTVTTPETTQTELANQDINLDPANDVEKQEAQDTKSNIVNPATPTVDSNTGKKKVTPVITYFGQDGEQISANVFVGGITEDGGSCRYDLTNGNLKIAKVTEAFNNASTTNCAPLIIQRDEFKASGKWVLSVSYNSNSSTGSSEQKEINVN